MTKTILQDVVFENTNASDLYEMFLSSKHHSNIRGGIPADIQPVEGSGWNTNSGSLYGKILKLVKDKLIVLSWRSRVSLKEGELDMIVVLHLIQSDKNAIIQLTHTIIPDNERYAIYSQNWNDRYWIPWKNHLKSCNNN
jgi:activator of HSP90 ATPase